MKEIKELIDRAEQRCKTRGSRLTKKRKRVLSGLLLSEKAMSAYELIDFYKTEHGETMPAMSMYRILEFLQSEHLVHKLNLANKFVACENIDCKGSHAAPQFLICQICQKVKEIGMSQSTVDELKKNVEYAGFHLVSPQLEMNCICENCQDSAA